MSHWTDPHIHHDGNDWIAYDEAGLEYGRYKTHNEARDGLVLYEAMMLSDRGKAFQMECKSKLLEGMLGSGVRHWFHEDLQGLKDHLDSKIEMLRR